MLLIAIGFILQQVPTTNSMDYSDTKK